MTDTPFTIDPAGRNAKAKKQALRHILSFQRLTINEDLKNTTQWKVINHLRTLHSKMSPAVVALYLPIHYEIDLTSWAQELWANGDTVVLPRVVEKGHPLVFNVWSKGMRMDTDRLGITCATGAEIWPSIMIIPCLGYSKQGFRLGYGGGYYDRTLKMMDLPTTTIGVSYTELEIPEFPSQYHDKKVDFFVTGKEVIAC